MMIFLDEINVSGEVIKFWKGFDLNTISNHPKDGKNGFMVVLIDSVKSCQRDNKIDSILYNRKSDNIYKVFQKLNNNWLMIYESLGEDDKIIQILKDKFSKKLFFTPYKTIDGFR